MAAPNPYSGTSSLALAVRVTAVTIGVAYGSMKLAFLKYQVAAAERKHAAKH